MPIALTNDTPFILTLPGTAVVNESGEVVSDLSTEGSGGALADLSNVVPATGRTALGATSTGAALFTAASADAARTALGATSIGSQVMTAASLTMAQLYLGIRGGLSILLSDVLSANARSYYLTIHSPSAITDIWIVNNDPVTGGPMTATFEVAPGVAMTPIQPLSIPVGPAGSGFGHAQFETAENNSIENSNVPLKVTIGGTNTGPGSATMTVRFSPTGI